MALQVETLTFVLRTGTGAQTVPLVRYPSLTPKAIIFTLIGRVDASNHCYCYGFDDGTTHLGTALGIGEQFAVAISSRQYDAQYSLSCNTPDAAFGGAVVRVRGYVTAMSAGSFSLQIDANLLPGSGWEATIIGGDDVTCTAGIYDVTPGSGNVVLGYRPAAVLKLSSPDAGTNGEVAGADHHYGFATDCDTNQVGWGVSGSAIAPVYASYQIDGVIQQDLNSVTLAVSDPVTLGITATGFSVTVSGSPLWNIGYLAIGGLAVSANLVQIIQPTTTGVQNTAITATDPVVAFFSSTCKVPTAGVGLADFNLLFGLYDGAAHRSGWWGAVNGSAFPFTRDTEYSTSFCITLATATGVNTSTINARATCTLSSENIALNWTIADATQREVWALVLAHNLTGSSNACGENPQASITVIKEATPIPGGATEFPFVTTNLTPSTFTLTDGASQLFEALSAGTYGVSEVEPDGWTVSYDVSNDDPHDAIVIVGTEAVTVTVTNTFQSTSNVLRRMRRFALPYDENVEMFLSRLEIIAAMGVGNADDPNPVIQFRLSRDGGNTWGSFQSMTIGAAANYTKRAYLTRLGRGRNLVGELICDDAVFVAWVQCVVQATRGTS